MKQLTEVVKLLKEKPKSAFERERNFVPKEEGEEEAHLSRLTEPIQDLGNGFCIQKHQRKYAKIGVCVGQVAMYPLWTRILDSVFGKPIINLDA